MNPNLNRAIFSEADAVSVQSEILKEGTRNYNNNITVIPNAIDLSLYHPKPKNNKKIRILWAGSISHEMDLRMIEEPLREVLEKYKDKVEYYTFGYDTDFFYKMRYVFVLGTKQFS